MRPNGLITKLLGIEMEPLSLFTGFLVGAFTGAAGTYLSDKYTDKRRDIESRKAEEKTWESVCKRFPKLIKEMQEDFKDPENSGVRRFFITERNRSINASEKSFAYYKSDHPDISAAMLYLEDVGYIQDITPSNCPMYRMYEHFVDRLKMTDKA